MISSWCPKMLVICAHFARTQTYAQSIILSVIVSTTEQNDSSNMRRRIGTSVMCVAYIYIYILLGEPVKRATE